MFNINFWVVLLGIGIAGLLQEPGFVVEGYIDNPLEGNMLIITGNASDTIARGPIVNGHFRLTGSVDTVTEAALIPEGQVSGGVPFFLENCECKFEANINCTNNVFKTRITGGPNQNIATIFYSTSLKYRFKMDDVAKEIREAQAKGDKEKVKEAMQRYEEINRLSYVSEDSLLAIYNDTYVAAYLVYLRSKSDPEALKEDSRRLGENAWKSTFGKRIKAELDQYERIQPGNIAPDFTAWTQDGDSVSLHSVKAKMKLLSFWASWSRPCQQSNMQLLELYNEFHDKGLEIVSLSMDAKKNSWFDALYRNPLPWTQLADLKNQSRVKELYVVNALPVLVLIDEDNCIIARNLWGEKLRDELEKRLDEESEK